MTVGRWLELDAPSAGNFSTMSPPGDRRFAWGDLSFEIPVEWDLAFHHRERALTRLRLADAVAVRVTVEWWRAARAGGINLERGRVRFHRMAAAWRRRAERTEAVVVPPSAEAWRFVFPDGREVTVGFHASPTHHAVALIQVHGETSPRENTGERARRLFASLKWHEGPLLPWVFYDLSFCVPAGFELLRTSLLAGRKELQFGWAGRRLWLAFHSLADRILRQQPNVWKWAVADINRSRVCPEVRFEVREQGVAVRRRFLTGWPISTLWRRCLRYTARVEHHGASNRLGWAVFNYRSPSDLDRFQALRLFADDPFGTTSPRAGISPAGPRREA